MVRLVKFKDQDLNFPNTIIKQKSQKRIMLTNTPFNDKGAVLDITKHKQPITVPMLNFFIKSLFSFFTILYLVCSLVAVLMGAYLTIGSF
jgi:hypothetical protein